MVEVCYPFGLHGTAKRCPSAVLIMVHHLAQSVVVGLIMGGFAAKNQTTIASMVVSLHSA